MVYKAPADRISVRDRAAFCFFLFLPGGKRGQRGHRTGPWGYGIGFKIWALPEIRAKPVFVWREMFDCSYRTGYGIIILFI
ncbi:hypothetical protein BLA28_05975 [Eisenbergiella tayi]|nr:hypothetical protein BLA28_05975 [Eisenbergiella tayi]